MTGVRRRPGRALVLAGVLFALAAPGSAQPPSESRLVVKYRNVDACIQCATEHGRSTGSASLDAVHRRIGVRRITPVFLPDVQASAAVRRRAWQDRMRAVANRHPGRATRGRPNADESDLSAIYELELPAGADVAAAAAELAADPDVDYAEPVGVRQVSYVPNDPFFGTSGTWGSVLRRTSGDCT